MFLRSASVSALAALLLSALAASLPRAVLASPPQSDEPIRPAPGTARSVAVSGGAIVLWLESREYGSSRLYAQKVDASGARLWGAGGVSVTGVRAPGLWTAAPDDAGGVIVAWAGSEGAVLGIYAQRIDASGVPLWTPNGLGVSTNAMRHDYPAVAPDGSGGAIIAWHQSELPLSQRDIYAQRVSAAGVPLWAADGLPVSQATGSQSRPWVIPSGEGGAVLAWNDTRVPTSSDYYVQRLDDQGVPQWTLDGVQITSGGFQDGLLMVPDLTGGAILAWREGMTQVYAQRVDGAGVVQWTSGGSQISSGPATKLGPAIAPDGAGGAVVAWADQSGIMVAQRVDAAGSTQWSGGVTACSSDAPSGPAILPDGNGGAFLTWQAYDPDHSAYDIVAQHVSGAGNPGWGPACVPVCTLPGIQGSPMIAGDGAGGVIIVWYDSRAGDIDHYAQRLNGAGFPQWAANGLPVHVTPGRQRHPGIVADGAGGAIMVWQEKRGENYDILATRVNALNVTVWPPRTVCGAAHRQRNPVALPDHAGGVVVVWLDERNGLRYPELYAQRLNSSGTPLWTPDGVPLAPGRMPSVTDALDVAPDGSGGVLVAWVGEFYPSSVIFAQRVSGAGAVEWESDGLQVCVGAFVDGPSGPHIASDGGSGAFIGWTDGRSGSGDVYAQHVSGTGVPLWTLNGIPVCPNGAEQGLNAMVSDGSGGVLFGWSEWPAGIPAAYAHRVDGDGNALWPGCGVALCNSPASQGSMRLAPDGAGGAIALWEDLRVPGDYDIYGQRVDASGNLLWPAAGAVVCAVEAHQFPVALTSDGSGGALALWSDSRPGAGGLYAQRIGSNGVALWTTDGVPVHTGTPSAEIPGLAPDGSGGAYAVWQKQHPPDGDILYSLRLTNAGAIASGWLADGIVPVLVSLVSARVERGIPRLSWHLGGASLATATVYRAAPAAAWEAVGAAMADGMGRLSYDDETVEPGRRYGYRLGVRDGGAEVFGGEVWIDVPSNAGPALAAASPTLGGHDGLRVEFDLPDAGPARLELHDLAGRLLSALEVGGLGPGHHAATLGPPGGLPPGIYLLRLTRGGRSLTARAAVLR